MKSDLASVRLYWICAAIDDSLKLANAEIEERAR